MSAAVLVAYATRYGSTQEVAETVAATLLDQRIEVHVGQLKRVRDVSGYAAVVIGTALHIGKWYKDTDGFLNQHREALAGRPVAVFALGPVSSPLSQEELQGSRAHLDSQLVKFPWLAPVAVEVFGGKYDPSRLRFPDNLIAGLPASPLKGMPASDVRDWAAIRAWASDLAAKIRPAAAAVRG